MCNADGSPKRFQTQIKGLALIKAAKESRRTGKEIRIYFCIHCSNWCLTGQKLIYHNPKHNSKKRRKKALRPQICDWENEGGSFGD